MLEHVVTTEDWERLVFATGAALKRESQWLDFKGDLSRKDKDEQIALTVLTRAWDSADGQAIEALSSRSVSPTRPISVAPSTISIARSRRRPRA